MTNEHFIHTSFLARQNVKRSAPNARRLPLMMILMGLTLMACFFLCLWVRIYIIEIGYQLSATLENHERLLQENRKLRIERASLRSPSRIEDIARNRLGMVIPAGSQVVVLRLPPGMQAGSSQKPDAGAATPQ